jgi:hypothetical protein
MHHRTSGEGLDTVAALFYSQADAERAIQDLKEAGFPQDRIGVVLRDPMTGPGEPQGLQDTVLPGETAAAGAVGGGILGGVVGLLAGVGALALPGVGPVIAGGALAASLTGAGVGAAAGGVLGALVGLGIPESSARYFEQGIRQGAVLVTVDAGYRREAARDILRFSRGDLGNLGVAYEEELRDAVEAEPEAWRGSERRYREDPAYAGPERRLARS